MAWNLPSLPGVGTIATVANWATKVIDSLRYLKGLDGAATFESDLTVSNLITAGNVDGVDVSAHAADTTTAHGAVSTATASKIVVRDAEGQAAFAAPAAAGDALIKGTALTITEMAALTTGKMWVGAANRPSEVNASTVVISSGQYTGNDAVNRAIAHGLGVTPKIVFIMEHDGSQLYRINGTVALICNNSPYIKAVTIPNATNFYVGNADSYLLTANGDTEVHDWVAIG